MQKKKKTNLVVKRSTAGLGLFTKKPIKQEELIIEYKGKRITQEAAENSSGKYFFELDDDTLIDGKSRTNLARYINHSCLPNCYTDIIEGRVFVFAKRNIKEGEELTYHYGKEYFNDIIKPLGCKCTKCLKKSKQSKQS